MAEDLDTKIQEVINRFYGPIENYEEGAPNTRYKSWEWCRKVFFDKKDEYKKSKDETKRDEIVDYLALHLANYLASWGMYRGSAFILQRDYKAHKQAVREILDFNCDGVDLWKYVPDNDNINEAKDLLFRDNGIYDIIKNKAYKNKAIKANNNTFNNDDTPTDTLVTKILMGTLACVPAFDRYLKAGIAWCKNEGIFGTPKPTQNIENEGATFEALSKFAMEYKDALNINGKKSATEYTTMKCLDMFLWEIGYELDIVKELNNDDNKLDKKDNILKQAKSLNLCSQNADYKAATEEIEKRLNELNKKGLDV